MIYHPPKRNWVPSDTYDACTTHMGWGVAYVLAFPPDTYPYYLSVLVFLLYIGIKEYIYDIHEEHDSYSGSTLDAITYNIGYGIGILAIYGNRYWAVLLAIVILVVLAWVDSYHFLPEKYPTE